MPYEITLNGANYVSEERKRAFEGSLTGGRPTVAMADRRDANGSEPAPVRAPAGGESVADTQAMVAAPATFGGPVNHLHVLESLERGLAQSYDHQSETLQVHQHYLSNEAAYAGIFAQLMQEQGALFAGSQGAPAQSELALTVLQALGQSMLQFHDHQSQTLTVHSQFLEQQAAYAQTFVDLLQRHYGAVLQNNGHTAGSGDAVGSGDVAGNGHGDGNGHSGAAIRGNGHEPQVPAVSHVGSAAAPPVKRTTVRPTAPPVPAGNAVVPASIVAAAPVAIPAPAAAIALSTEALVASLLSIVSEKTGYPAEMLDLEMDMEADLGIDSIKRVEILGALEEAHPDLPTVAPEALAELKTLAQVIAATNGRTDEPAPAQTAPERGSAVPGVRAIQEVLGPTTSDTSRVTQDLLAIVSEKTGYPAEMLDLSMDMEADLGIDSIKRVEIIGALQEMYPGLGEIEVEALAALRTLADILGHAAGAVAGTTVVPEAAPPKKA